MIGRMKFAPLLLLPIVSIAFAQSGQIEGVVVDGRGGEALARVKIQLMGTDFQTVTDDKGKFRMEQVTPGDYKLKAATVGYRVVEKQFSIAAGEEKHFDITLSAEALRQTDSVDVHEGAFDVAGQTSPSEMKLSGSEAKNTASVLADDPLRAVQSMPGVTANDDFNSRFSVRGADYSRIGLYLDSILLHSPFHAVETSSAGGSLTIFNGDMIDEMSLYSGAPPVQFGDRTAGILDIHSRDGNSTGITFRGTASASNAGGIAEGPIGDQGSWMVGARKSYLQYILDRLSSDPSLAFGFWDVQARVSYNVTKNNNVTWSFLQGDSSLDRSKYKSTLGVNSIMEGSFQFTMLNLGWKYSPVDGVVVTSHAAYLRENSGDSNPSNLNLDGELYGEFVGNSNVTWAWSGHTPLDAGVSVRRVRDSGFTDQYQFTPFAVHGLNRYEGNTVIAGGYVQQAWSSKNGRVNLAAGTRWDTESLTSIVTTSPFVSLSVAPWKATRIQIGWGQYAQFPELQQLLSTYGNKHLLPERANHIDIALDQKLDERTRVRVEVYQRDDRDLVERPLYDPRLIGTKIFNPPVNALFENSARGYAKGAEIFLQRRSANKLTGWVSYALNYTRLRDGVANVSYPSDQDQRHTVNVYGSYRLRPTVNLSLKVLYGSGFPIPGYFRMVGTQYYLSNQLNQTRLGYYQRTDFRINKAWVKDRWKITLYGEVVNLLDKKNYRFDSFNGYNGNTGLASITLTQLFPILPAAGVVFER